MPGVPLSEPGAPAVLDGLVDLASEAFGGRAVEANDEFFAEKENLLKRSEAVFIADKYTDRGKWMDGWETRRRRTSGHDWCVVELGLPGVVRRVIVDTRHFSGNHPEACSIEGRAVGSNQWAEILPRSLLEGDSPNAYSVEASAVFTSLRLNIYPDGGVARLRVFGEPWFDWTAIQASQQPVDLVSAVRGGAPLACSDRFFSDPSNLLMPGHSTHMGDGWETRRRRGPGHDWVVLRLGHRGTIKTVDVDTSHFKGNYPASCSIEACDLDGGVEPDPADWDSADWTEILDKQELSADAMHSFGVSERVATHVRFHIYPDGGVARLRLLGHPTA
jgi:allantoicase